jgi:hypothetical protein
MTGISQEKKEIHFAYMILSTSKQCCNGLPRPSHIKKENVFVDDNYWYVHSQDKLMPEMSRLLNVLKQHENDTIVVYCNGFNGANSIGRNPNETSEILNTLNSITKKSLTLHFHKGFKRIGVLHFPIAYAPIRS